MERANTIAVLPWDVNQNDRDEHDVRGGDVWTRFVERERGGGEHECHDGAALLARGRSESSPSTRRRSRRNWMRAFLAAIS